MSNMEEESGVSVLEAARLLNVSRTKTYELLNRQDIRARKIGRRTVVSRISISEYLTDARHAYGQGSR